MNGAVETLTVKQVATTMVIQDDPENFIDSAVPTLKRYGSGVFNDI